MDKKDQILYWYSFSATTKKIYKESLYHAPKGKKALVFFREGQEYTFTEDKARRNLIAQTVAHGTSELYSISEFGTKTAENIRKGYMVGKYGAIPELNIEEVD